MDIIFEIVSVRTFWRILLFVHFLMAVGLLAAVTLQAVAVMVPVRQAAGKFVQHLRPGPAASYVTVVVLLYVPTFLLGAWIYIKYRTYVRIPMEQVGQWWTVGSFEFKEHVVTMGMGLLPAYWYFWRQPLTNDYLRTRAILTSILAFIVWWSFLVGHILNNIRGFEA